MGLFDEIANRATGATDPNQRMSPAAERAMAANKNVREAVERANKRGQEIRQQERDQGRDPDKSIKTQDELVTAQQARLGNLPEQQSKIDPMDIFTPKTIQVLGTLVDTIFGNKVVGQAVLEKLKAAQEDPNKTIQDAINEMTNKEYQEYIQLQSKLSNPEVTGAFLSNTLKIDGEDTGIPIQDLLEQTGEGIFSLDDPLIKNVQMQLANNPDLTFAQSLGFGTPDDFMSQVDALRALGPRAVESLKVLNPEKYYGTIEEGGFGFRPTTNQELENLAKMDIGAANAAGNKGLVNAIADARFQLRQGKSDDRQQAGIPSVVPPPVTPPGAPQPPVVPFPPMTGFPTFPGLVQGAPQFNYGAFPQFNLSTYAQQGIANPNLAAFYQNLGRIA
jgi:vacuolar-type H+-ATPase subunit H